MKDRVEQRSFAENRKRERHLLRLKLSGWGRLGEALAEHDGKTVFVFGGISGEDVIAEVIKKDRRYITSKVVKVLSPSSHRVNPPCKYFGQCTGCQWQHIEYPFQLTLKKEMVVDSLQRVGKINNPCVSDPIASPLEFGYRNHARFTVSPQGDLGFVNRQNNKLVPVEQCLIMHDGINGALKVLNGACAETTQLSIRYGTNTGDMLIQPQLKNSELSIPSGQKHYSEKLKGKIFCIDSPSFFQVNTRQAEKIVDVITAMLSPNGTELLVDLYGGVGTFAILLAPWVRRVVGIEESLPAIQNARKNSEESLKVEFVQGKAEVVMASLEEVPDFVILDPPRKGCSEKVLDALVQLAPKKIIYVSCDPNTMARDLKILCGGPFEIAAIQPVDLFPQTHHLECIVSLEFKGHNGPVILASKSPRRKQLMENVYPIATIKPSEFEEIPRQNEEAEVMVKRLALGKASKVASAMNEGLILGADTVVVYQDNVLGKPVDKEEAVATLKILRGKAHHVVTGIAIVDVLSGDVRTTSKTSTVIMADYTDKEIEEYVQTGKASDKAGGYGIQDNTFRTSSTVIGCYSNVVGLPVCVVSDMLAWFGLKREVQVCVNTLEKCQLCSKIKEGLWTYLE